MSIRAGRLPLEPVLAFGVSISDIARRLGIHGRQVYRWRDMGVPVDDADRLAIAVGYHPAEVWPEYIDLVAQLVADERRAKRRAGDRRRRATETPAQREARLEYQREWRERHRSAA